MNQERFIKEITDLSLIVYRINRSIGKGGDQDDFCGIPPAQFHTLMVIRKGKRMNMSSIADWMMVTRQQLTRMIDSLVEKGLVARSNDPANRRHVMIELTEAGEQHVNETLLSGHNVLSQLTGSVSEEDMEKMLQAVTMIKEVLSKVVL